MTDDQLFTVWDEHYTDVISCDRPRFDAALLRAVLAASLASQATAELPSSAFNIPAGFALVPLEPTQAIVEAFVVTGGHHPNQRWPALLAVAAVDAVPGKPVASPYPPNSVLDLHWRRGFDGLWGLYGADFVPEAKAAFEGGKAARLTAPVASRAGMEPAEERLAYALDLLDWMRGYPDFSDPEHPSPVRVAIEEVIAGNPSSMLTSCNYLAQGLRPPSIAPAAPAEAKDAVRAEPVAWREHVEKRLWSWRQSFVNKSGDQLTLEDFMDKRSMDDLINYVLDESAEPRSKGDTQ